MDLEENLYGRNGMRLDDFSIEWLTADGWLRWLAASVGRLLMKSGKR